MSEVKKVCINIDAAEVAKIIMDKVGMSTDKRLSDCTTMELLDELGKRTSVDIRDLYSDGTLVQKIVTVDVYA